jgi:DNA-nicking Smr family endonuclease
MKKSQSSLPDRPDIDFRAAMQDVVPLDRIGRVEPNHPRPAPVPLQRLRDEREVLAESLVSSASPDTGLATGEELVFVRNGIPHDVLRKLRRGKWVIQDEFDLHGLTAAQARPATAAFLQECRQRGIRCVRIIHGKGLRSHNRVPVLKRKLGHWLMIRDEVLAFCEARATDGGSGAVVVLLRG